MYEKAKEAFEEGNYQKVVNVCGEAIKLIYKPNLNFNEYHHVFELQEQANKVLQETYPCEVRKQSSMVSEDSAIELETSVSTIKGWEVNSSSLNISESESTVVSDKSNTSVVRSNEEIQKQDKFFITGTSIDESSS